MKNKKAFLLISIVFTILLVSGPQVKAQKVELSPFIGYETGANIDYNYNSNVGNLHIGDGMDWGGSLDVGMGGGRYGEFSYSHMATYLDSESGINNERLCDLAVDYYSFGVLQEVNPDAKATPYGLFSLGWVNYRPSETYSNENKMHISLAGGVKIRASERVGLRLQARLLLPIYYSGGYLFAGTGGAGYGITGGFRGVQGDFTAALVLNLR
jgi:hypothetical protein